MDDREFFDVLYQLWVKTTGARDTYWRPESSEDGWTVYAQGQGERTIVATGLSERDADFICGIHGCLPDVVRKLNMALDEAERADTMRDEQQHMIAELVRKNC